MMKPEYLIEDIDTCRGPCGELCLSCPEGWYLKEIREVLVYLFEENKKLRAALTAQTGEVDII